MDKAKLDVIVLFSAENIFYLTQSPTVLRLKDFQQTRPNSSRLIITIKEKNKNESILLVPEFDYKEKEIFSIEPNWDKTIIGNHTFNSIPNFTVSDAIVKSKKGFF